MHVDLLPTLAFQVLQVLLFLGVQIGIAVKKLRVVGARRVLERLAKRQADRLLSIFRFVDFHGCPQPAF